MYTWCETGQAIAIDRLVLLQHHPAEVFLQDLLPLDHGGQVDGDVPVEPPRPQQSFVQHITPGAGKSLQVGGNVRKLGIE